MLIVADDIDRTERDLTAGELACPDCHGELRPWGHARRRWLRARHGRREICPRRGCCRGCGRPCGELTASWRVVEHHQELP